MGLQRKFHSSSFNLSSAAPFNPSRNLSQGTPHGHSRSMENLLEPRRERAHTAPDVTSAAPSTSATVSNRRPELDSRKSSFSTSSGDETDFSFSSSGSLSGTEADEALVSGEVSPSSSATSSPTTSSPTSSNPPSPSAANPPRVPPRPQAQEIFARCTTYTRKAAMASRARLFPQQMEIQTR